MEKPQDQTILRDDLLTESLVEKRLGLQPGPDSDIGSPTARIGGPGERPVDPPGSASTSTAHNGAGRFLVSMGKRLATFAVVVVAGLAAVVTWQRYVLAPWTRNGNIRVQVANIAPQVSGQIVDLRVSDNQFVRQGDVLYVIDPFDYDVVVRTRKAQVAQAAADLDVKKAQLERRQHLSSLATTPEEQQTFAGSAAQAKAVFDAAQQQLAQAELNLKRTNVVSPVSGYVTNLLLRVGDYAVTGASNISVIDSNSFWIDGYFEETKMAGICVGDRVEAQLMGYSQPIIGHVETITRGISVSNAALGAQGLPNVNPIYTWVRLAQRVPVRIAIDNVPPGVPLVSGMTATVTIMQPEDAARESLFRRTYKVVSDSLSDLVHGPQPSRPGCLPPATSQPTSTESIAVPQEPTFQSAEEIAPGIAPGMNIPPRLK